MKWITSWKRWRTFVKFCWISSGYPLCRDASGSSLYVRGYLNHRCSKGIKDTRKIPVTKLREMQYVYQKGFTYYRFIKA